MQNRKWILSSLVMTFFGIPILTQFLAAVVAMLGVGLAGIIEVCNILITPTSYLLLNIFMLALGALMLFFSGRVWAGDSAPEKREIAVWRQGNDSNLLIVFYVQIMPDDFVMQLHRF